MNQNGTIQENELDSLSDHVPNLPDMLDLIAEQVDRVATTRITMDESSTETSTLVAEIMVSVCFFYLLISINHKYVEEKRDYFLYSTIVLKRFFLISFYKMLLIYFQPLFGLIRNKL